jgi:hypothetical protein
MYIIQLPKVSSGLQDWEHNLDWTIYKCTWVKICCRTKTEFILTQHSFMFELVLTSTSLDKGRYVNLGDKKGHEGTVL